MYVFLCLQCSYLLKTGFTNVVTNKFLNVEITNSMKIEFFEFRNLIMSKHVSFQSHQEQNYQQYVATKAKEKCTQQEQYYEQILTRTQAELNSTLEK